MINAQNRSLWGSLAGAVKAICALIISGVGTANRAVSMADKSVRTAQKKQIVDITYDMQDYAVRQRNAAALKLVKSHEEITDFVGNDEKRAKLMEQACKTLDDALAKEMAELAANDAAS